MYRTLDLPKPCSHNLEWRDKNGCQLCLVGADECISPMQHAKALVALVYTFSEDVLGGGTTSERIEITKLILQEQGRL